MKESKFSSLSDLIDRLQSLSSYYRVLETSIKAISDRDINVDKIESELYKLHIECELLSTVLVEKFKQLDILQNEMLLKFYPRLARDFDKNAYEKATQSPIPIPVDLDLRTQYSSIRNQAFLSDHFKQSTQTNHLDIYSFLVSKQFIEPENEITLSKMLLLEIVEPNKRLIWIDKSKRGPALRTLVRLVTNLIDSRTPKKHVKKYYGALITAYFKPPESEFKSRSLDTIASKILNEDTEYGNNERENVIEDFFKIIN